VSKLIETLVAQLERPRELAPKVVTHISNGYSIEREAVGTFLTDELPKLEDYEIDLILSPVFTPRLPDQAIIAEILGRDAVPREQWPALVDQLVARPTSARLVTSDGKVHSTPLRAVSIERYVHRLRLDGTIPESLFQLLDQPSFTADRSMLKAIARRSAWESEGRRKILEQYLSNAARLGEYSLEDATALLTLVESYQPADATNLLVRIPAWLDILRDEINKGSGPKPFFSAQVQASHGGEDNRTPDTSRMSAKQRDLEFLQRLQQILAS
jgi:hypothetical protein